MSPLSKVLESVETLVVAEVTSGLDEIFSPTTFFGSPITKIPSVACMISAMLKGVTKLFLPLNSFLARRLEV